MSSLLEYAKKEIELAGLLDEDADYNGMIGQAVLELVKTFSEQEHSGFSAGMTLAIFDKVARFKPLTDITSNPAEWMEVETGKMWQSKRNPTIFSKDGGKTWYDLDNPKDQ